MYYTFKYVSVRRRKVLDTLSWLTQNNYAVEALPLSGIPSELLTVETNDDICDEPVELFRLFHDPYVPIHIVSVFSTLSTSYI